MENPKSDKAKNQKIREQVGILLICIVIAGSGFLVLSKKSTQEVKFTKSEVVNSSPGSIDKSSVTTTASTPDILGKININTAFILQ